MLKVCIRRSRFVSEGALVSQSLLPFLFKINDFTSLRRIPQLSTGETELDFPKTYPNLEGNANAVRMNIASANELNLFPLAFRMV
jgi:hypothetical protein